MKELDSIIDAVPTYCQEFIRAMIYTEMIHKHYAGYIPKDDNFDLIVQTFIQQNVSRWIRKLLQTELAGLNFTDRFDQQTDMVNKVLLDEGNFGCRGMHGL